MDFPDPDGPTIDMKSPGHDLQRHVAEGEDLDLLAVHACDATQFEERLQPGGPSGGPAGGGRPSNCLTADPPRRSTVSTDAQATS